MPRTRSISQFQDDTLLFKSMLSMKAMIGLGLLAGSVMPWQLSLSLGVLMVCGTVLSRLGFISDPITEQVVPGRKTAIIKGDFVVFHIGARPNRHVDGFFKWMGEAIEEMTRELEENPESGCLGTEMFYGVTGPLLIQYWKSLDHLNAWARSSARHTGPWAKLMKEGRESADYGFWHEAFEVKAGKYETIYANCPPMLLGNCRNVELEQISGKMQSAAGRVGKTDGSDYPTHLGKPDY